jgi:transposase
VQSSRGLGREAWRDVEVMLLTGRPVPDRETIADFRKIDGAAIGKVSAAFPPEAGGLATVALCRRVGPPSKASVAIGGSEFEAANDRDRDFASTRTQHRLAPIEESVAHCLRRLDGADRQAPTEAPEKRKPRPRGKPERPRAETGRPDGPRKQMEASPDGRTSLTDPDARSRATSGRGWGAATMCRPVDTERHPIVAHDVVTTGSDRSQLRAMAMKAEAALEVDTLAVVADRGPFESEEILACDRAGMAAILPEPVTSSATKAERFGKEDFRYSPAGDVCRCPGCAPRST